MPIKDPERRREYNRAWRQARIDAGKCWGCDNPPVNGTTRCLDCAEKERQQGLARRARYRVQGQCVICGKGVRSKRLSCADCVERESNRQRRFRAAVLDHYGRSCACCGEDQVMFLCIDHVANDGAAHRAAVGTGSKVMAWLVQEGFPEGFQTLCWNCNAGKHLNGGVCPHKDR